MIQDFEAPPKGQSNQQHLAALRTAMRRAAMDAFLVPRADEHQGEYVAPCAQRLAWLTGFTGSAGIAVVTLAKAALFVDGRYTLQAPQQVDTGDYEIHQVPEQKLSDWLRASLPKGGVAGFDPWLHTIDEIVRLKAALEPAGIRLKALARNPVDKIWGTERPPAPAAPVIIHPLKYAGQSAEDKLADIQATLKKDGQDAVILTLPDSICWALNIRGRDVAHNPVVLAFAIIPRSGRAELFIESAKIDANVRTYLKPLARIRPAEALPEHLAALKIAAKKVRVDTARSAWWFAQKLGGVNRLQSAPDPCILPKAKKNAAEIAGTRNAHRRDGAALCRFLAWLDTEAPSGRLTEIDTVRRLENERAATGELIDLSFDTISGSGPNGAIVHYRVTTATDRKLQTGELFLLDSGAQYADGTTDVTRTIAIGTPTAEMRRCFTAVLKGHIAIATARFPADTRGVDLDPFARRALWLAGLDYDHGTGHGVGSFLSVHEGPASISKRGMVPLEAGMILSNEPGYYRTGAFGIRIENLLLVKPPEAIKGGERQMLSFEDLTLVPIDRRLIDVATLTAEEIGWLDGYHTRVYREIAPLLDGPVRKWLKGATERLSAH